MRDQSHRPSFRADLEDGALVELARSARVESDVIDALRELSRRRSPERLGVARGILADAKRSRRLRATAAVELGTEALPENQRLLIKAMVSEDSTVSIRALQSLGRIGDKGALSKLEALEIPAAPNARQAISFAKSLISYRLRLDTHLLRPPAANRYVAVSDSGTFAIMSPKRGEVDKAIRDTALSLPAVLLAKTGATKLQCGRMEYVLAIAEAFRTLRATATICEKSALPCVLLRKDLALDRYVLDTYVFTQPAIGGDGVRLLGVRPKGDIVYGGTGSIADGQASFTLRSVKTRLAPAIDVEGSYDLRARSWRFGRARVGQTVSAGKSSAKRLGDRHEVTSGDS